MLEPRYSAMDIVGRIAKLSQGDEINPTSQERGIRGAMIGVMDAQCGGPLGRYSLLYRLFPGRWTNPNSVTTKDLTDTEWHALFKWIEPYKDEDEGKWKGHEALFAEIDSIYNFAWSTLSHG